MVDPFAGLMPHDDSSNAIIPLPGDDPAPAAELARLRTRSADYATRAFAGGTLHAYRSAWRGFSAWCARHDLDPFGGAAGPVPLYVTHLADLGRAVSSIRVALAAIATAYRLSGLALDLHDPCLGAVVEGATRALGTRSRRQAEPVVPELLRAMLAQCGGDDIAGAARRARNRAMLLLGFGGALRRSELAGLRLGDVAIVEGRGVTLLIRRSKTDQHGAGQSVAVWGNPDDQALCPAVALQAWLDMRARAPDMTTAAPAALPLFVAISRTGTVTSQALSDKAVVRLIKTAAAGAGYDAADFSGHSLRAGLVTAAVNAGAELASVMRQARHAAPATTMRYYRPAELWQNNVTKRIFEK